MLLGLCRSTGAFADSFSCVVGCPRGLEDGKADDSLPLPLSLPFCLSCRLCTISSQLILSQLRSPTPLVNRFMSLPRRSVTCLLSTPSSSPRLTSTTFSLEPSSWQNFVDYQKCITAKGEEFEPCQKFKHTYQSLCPNDWVDTWNEQVEAGKARFLSLAHLKLRLATYGLEAGGGGRKARKMSVKGQSIGASLKETRADSPFHCHHLQFPGDITP